MRSSNGPVSRLRELRVGLLLVVLCGAAFVAPAAAQDTAQDMGRDPGLVLQRYRAYLERNPFHPRAFDQLVAAAVEAGRLDALVGELEALLAEGAASDAQRVLLARLYARVERYVEAVDLLGGDEVVPGPDAARRELLLGELLAAAGRAELALQHLASAAAGAEGDAELAERAVRARASAALALGRRDDAAAAYADLWALDPRSFALRMDAADALAAADFADLALAAYREAAELAGDDVARRCRALASLGTAAERAARYDEALAAWSQVIASTGRGSWLRRDLFARELSLHERLGTLDRLVAQETQAVAELPGDIDHREQLARAHLAARRPAEARAVLAQAVATFPEDLDLGRLHLVALERDGDVAGRVSELQRLIEAFPAELDLYLELGDLLAGEGRLEEARRQWQRTLERRLDDPHLCLRLAEVHALHGLHEERVALVERAVALDPADLDAYSALASALAAAGRRDEVPSVADRALAAAGDDAGQLERFAQLAVELGLRERALAALERATTRTPAAPRPWLALARLREDQRDFDGALAAYRTVVALDDDPQSRRAALDRLGRVARISGDLNRLRDAEGQRAADGDLVARLTFARLAREAGDERESRAALEAYLEERPRDAFALGLLADDLADDGRVDEAVARYRELADVRPADRSRALRRIAEVYLSDEREDDALAAYREAFELQQGSPAAAVEAAAFFVRAGAPAEARAVLEAAVRAHPEDARARLALARRLSEEGDRAAAEEQARRVAQTDDPGPRDGARELLYELWVQQGTVDEEIARLRADLARNPYDEAPALALADLWKRELEYALALDMLDDLLAVRPRSTALLRERAWLLEETLAWPRARADHETLARLDPDGRDEHLFAVGRCALRAGDREGAQRALVGLPARRVAKVYRDSGLREEALALLVVEGERAPDDAALQGELGDLYRALGRREEARAAQRRAAELRGMRLEDAIALAREELQDGGTAEAVALVADAILRLPLPSEEDGADRRTLSRAWAKYSDELGRVSATLGDDNTLATFLDVAGQVLARRPLDRVMLGQAVAAARWNPARTEDVWIIVRRVRAETLERELSPAGMDLRRWERTLDGYERDLERMSPELARRHAEELGAAGGEVLTSKEIEELLAVHELAGDRTAQRELLERAIGSASDEPRWRAARGLMRLQDGEWTGVLEDLEPLLPAARSTRLGIEPGRLALQRLTDRGLTPEQAEAVWRVHRPAPDLTPEWRLGRMPDAGPLHVAVATARARQGDLAGARDALAPLAPNHPQLVALASALAQVQLDLGLVDDARALDARTRAECEAFAADPVLAPHAAPWRSEVAELFEREARAAELAGDALQAYLLRRRWEGAEEARLGLAREGAATLLPVLQERFERALAEASETSEVARDAAVPLVEVLSAERRYADALAVLERVERQPETDPRFQRAHVDLLGAAGRGDEACALLARRVADLELGDEQHAAHQEDEGAGRERPSELAPELGRVWRTDDVLSDELRDADFYWRSFGPSGESRIELFAGAYAAADYAGAADALRPLVEAEPDLAQYVRWEFTQSLVARGNPAEALPLVQVMRAALPTEAGLVAFEAKLLGDAGRTDEARALCAEYLAQWPGDGEVQSVLDRLDRGEAAGEPAVHDHGGAASEPSRVPNLTALESAVAADPRAARPRIELAERQLQLGRYDDALATAREAERLAPHLPAARSVALRALAATGTDDGFDERVLAFSERATEEHERLAWAQLAAERAWARGDALDADAALDAAVTKGSAPRAAGLWWWAHGDLERARAWLERAARGAVAGGLGDAAQRDLARLAVLVGDAEPVVRWLRAGMLENWEMSDGERLWTHVDLLRMVGVEDGEQPVALALDEQLAELPRETGGSLRAALALACGDPRRAEAELLRAAQEGGPTGRRLLPLAVELARERGDWAAALAYLERAPEVSPLREGRVETGLGAATSRGSWSAERGALHLALGDRARALELWDEGLASPADRALDALLSGSLSIDGRAPERWAAVPALDRARDPRGNLFEAVLARRAGDVEAELRWLSEAVRRAEEDREPWRDDQGVPPGVVRAAELLREAGRGDEAPAWIEQHLVRGRGRRPAAALRIARALERGDLERALSAARDHAASDLIAVVREAAELLGEPDVARRASAIDSSEDEHVHATILLSTVSAPPFPLEEPRFDDGDSDLARLARAGRWSVLVEAHAALPEHQQQRPAERLLLARALAHLDRMGEATAEVVAALALDAARADGPARDAVRALWSTAAGRAAALAAGGDPRGALRLRYLIARERGQDDEALRLARELAADDAGRDFLAPTLVEDLVRAGELAEALDVLEARRLEGERRAGAQGIAADFDLAPEVRLALAVRGPEAALTRALGRDVGAFLPRSTVSSEQLDRDLLLLQRVGLLDGYRVRRALAPSSTGLERSDLRAGVTAPARAFESAWRRLVTVRPGVAAGPFGSANWSERSVRDLAGDLLDCALEAGRAADLRGRLADPRWARDPNVRRARLGFGLLTGETPAELADLRLDDARDAADQARLLARAGRPAEALSALDGAWTAACRALLSVDSEAPRVDVEEPPGSVRFAYPTDASIGLSTVSRFWYEQRERPGALRDLAWLADVADELRFACAVALGSADEAGAREQDLARRRGAEAPALALARAGAFGEALARALASPALAEADRGPLVLRLARLAREDPRGLAGEDRRDLLAALERAALDDPRQAWERACLLAEAGVDVPRIARAREAAQAADPEWSPGRTTRAWLALGAGEAASARALAEEQLAACRVTGEDSAPARAVLACALEALGDAAGARDAAGRAVADGERGARVVALAVR